MFLYIFSDYSLYEIRIVFPDYVFYFGKLRLNELKLDIVYICCFNNRFCLYYSFLISLFVYYIVDFYIKSYISSVFLITYVSMI